MKKKKGFTLVELLAVIVILAVILVIAVPQIMSVIESARKGSIESTAKLIAEAGEREYTNRKILGKDTNIECSEVANLNDKDYGSCKIIFDNAGKATVSIAGKGKFEGYTCKGNSTNMECIKGEPIPTDAQYFTYSVVEAGDSESDRTADVTIKNKDKCESYLTSKFSIPDGDEEGKKYKETICTGGTYNDGSMSILVSGGNIPSSDYEMAGIEVSWIIINNVTVKDKDKCVAYLPTTGATEEQANRLCSGNALDDWKIKDAVQEGFIPSSDYATAGLEVTSRSFEADKISITGYNSGFSVEITDQEKCKAYVKENNITNDSLAEMLCAGESYTKIDYYVSNNSIPKSDYKTAGLEVTYKNGGGPDVVIPSMIDGKKVVEIKGSSFLEKGITSVILPNTVTSIGGYAFYGNQITSLTLSNGVKTIGAFAFEHNKLTEVTLPSSVTNINESAFAYNKLTSINFPTTPLNLTCDPFHDNPITKDGTYTYPDNVTVVECLPS